MLTQNGVFEYNLWIQKRRNTGRRKIYIRIYIYKYIYIYLRRKQPPATAWYAVLSYGADSAAVETLLRDLLLYISVRVLVSFEDEPTYFSICRTLIRIIIVGTTWTNRRQCNTWLSLKSYEHARICITHSCFNEIFADSSVGLLLDVILAKMDATVDSWGECYLYKESYHFVGSVQETAWSRIGRTIQAALHHRGVLSGDHHEPDWPTTG